MSGPSDALDTPYPHDSIPSKLDDLVGITSWLSPSEYLRKGIEWVFGVNPGEEIAEWLLGDWQGLSRAGSAMGQLAEYCEAYGNHVAVVSDLTMFHWSGHAASATDAYLQGLADNINDTAVPMRQLGDAYQDMAVAMKEFAGLVADGVHTMEDKLIAIGVKLVASALLSETVVGSLAMGAWAISDAEQIRRKLVELKDAYDTVGRDLNTAIGTVSALCAAGGAGATLEIPGEYRLPGATW